MHYHSNHSWCRDCNWGDDYDVKHTVSIDKYDSYDRTKSLWDQDVSPDWTNNIDEASALSLKEYDFNKRVFAETAETAEKHDTPMTDEQLRKFSMRDCPTPNDTLLQWLNDNVLPSTDKNRKDRPEGWCMGSDEYRMIGGEGFIQFWFLRRRDAMNFIKEFSTQKKPTSYFNYFNDDSRKLVNGKLVKVKRDL